MIPALIAIAGACLLDRQVGGTLTVPSWGTSGAGSEESPSAALAQKWASIMKSWGIDHRIGEEQGKPGVWWISVPLSAKRAAAKALTSAAMELGLAVEPQDTVEGQYWFSVLHAAPNGTAVPQIPQSGSAPMLPGPTYSGQPHDPPTLTDSRDPHNDWSAPSDSAPAGPSAKHPGSIDDLGILFGRPGAGGSPQGDSQPADLRPPQGTDPIIEDPDGSDEDYDEDYEEDLEDEVDEAMESLPRVDPFADIEADVSFSDEDEDDEGDDDDDSDDDDDDDSESDSDAPSPQSKDDPFAGIE